MRTSSHVRSRKRGGLTVLALAGAFGAGDGGQFNAAFHVAANSGCRSNGRKRSAFSDQLSRATVFESDGFIVDNLLLIAES
jgi:hypothetical protein